MSDALPLSAALCARAGGQATPELEAALAALVQAGQQGWPGVALPPEDFVSHLAGHLGAEGAAEADRGPALQRLNACDLYLACACARGVPTALAAFDATLLGEVPAMIGHIDASPAFADEVRQVLRVNLLVGEEGPPRIAEYAGRGPLHAWVRIAATRVALRLRRRRVTDGQERHEGGGLDDLPGPALGPELAHIKDRYQGEFKEALEQALSGLPSQQRNVLRLQLIEGLTGDQIAALFRVNRSTVVRWLMAARAAVLSETQRRLQQRLRLSPEEFQSLAGVVHSQLDLSLSRLLRTDTE